jgi:transposase
VRIPKRKKHPNQEQRKAIFKEAMGSASDAEITERHGIHRATLYRMLKRGGGEG